ncbi:hypothetical protein BC835DRAFT_1331581 [Cytidiella melzeri]|nr:hypothetical protein BC835DRAFT_1331581 [Cytidiella melzeri]
MSPIFGRATTATTSHELFRRDALGMEDDVVTEAVFWRSVVGVVVGIALLVLLFCLVWRLWGRPSSGVMPMRTRARLAARIRNASFVQHIRLHWHLPRILRPSPQRSSSRASLSARGVIVGRPPSLDPLPPYIAPLPPSETRLLPNSLGDKLEPPPPAYFASSSTPAVSPMFAASTAVPY